MPHVLRVAAENLRPELLRDVLAHGVALVAVHPAFALLEVDGVRWQVPVHDRMAVGVEVQPLLANRRGREDEGPEWGVERLSHLSLARARRAVVALLRAETHGEVVAQAAVLDPGTVSSVDRSSSTRGAPCAKRQRACHRHGQPCPGLLVFGCEEPLEIP